MDIKKQIAAALARLATMDRQALINLRRNAERFGPTAAELVTAIDGRLAELGGAEAMAGHRREFARSMLRIVDRSRPLEWIASRGLFHRAMIESADNAYAVWLQGNSARKIPLTKALEEVLREFADIERRKDGAEQGARVWYRRAR